jgi:hypothetical protein
MHWHGSSVYTCCIPEGIRHSTISVTLWYFVSRQWALPVTKLALQK